MQARNNHIYDMVALFFNLGESVIKYILSIGGEHSFSGIDTYINKVREVISVAEINPDDPCFSKKTRNYHVVRACIRFKYKNTQYYIYYIPFFDKILSCYTTLKLTDEESPDRQVFYYSDLFSVMDIKDFDCIDSEYINDETSMRMIFDNIFEFTKKYFLAICYEMQDSDFIIKLKQQRDCVIDIYNRSGINERLARGLGEDFYVKGSYKRSIKMFESMKQITAYEYARLSFMKECLANELPIKKQPLCYSQSYYSNRKSNKKALRFLAAGFLIWLVTTLIALIVVVIYR